MATFNGLSSFHPGTKVFVNYFTQDGLMENEFREGKSLQGIDGTLYFPTNKGFTSFHPDEILPDLKNVSVFFTGFKIFDKEKRNTAEMIAVEVAQNDGVQTPRVKTGAFHRQQRGRSTVQ